MVTSTLSTIFFLTSCLNADYAQDKKTLSDGKVIFMQIYLSKKRKQDHEAVLKEKGLLKTFKENWDLKVALAEFGEDKDQIVLETKMRASDGKRLVVYGDGRAKQQE
ncbi:MAG: hypothetical protein HRT57_09275 [Crocinitomicaceae bacterium]|nr:hypothetical protein [Crocinitomicaceae bacterium]